MYPMHKLTPTPFGTYLLYMDQGPIKYKVEKFPYQKPQARLPAYNKVKEYGRRNNLTNNLLVVQAYLMNQPRSSDDHHHNQQRAYADRREVFTADDPLWHPKLKSRHRSYNMRYLRHSGQPIAETPAEILRYTDDVTGASVTPNDEWYKHRLRLRGEYDDETSYGYDSRLSSETTITTKKSSRKEHKHRHRSRKHHRSKSRDTLPSVFDKRETTNPLKPVSKNDLRKFEDVKYHSLKPFSRNENKEKFTSPSKSRSSTSVAVHNKVKLTGNSDLVERIKSALPSYQKSCFPSLHSPTKDEEAKKIEDDCTASRMLTNSTTIKSRRSRLRDISRMTELPPIPENTQGVTSPTESKDKRPDAVRAVKRSQSVEYKSVSHKYPSPSPVYPQHSRIEEGKKNIVTGRELLPFKWQNKPTKSFSGGRKSAVVDTTNPEIVMRELRKLEDIEKMKPPTYKR